LSAEARDGKGIYTLTVRGVAAVAALRRDVLG
jgi:hypothetical protein